MTVKEFEEWVQFWKSEIPKAGFKNKDLNKWREIPEELRTEIAKHTVRKRYLYNKQTRAITQL